jgi:hypothetical protein
MRLLQEDGLSIVLANLLGQDFLADHGVLRLPYNIGGVRL